MVQQQYLYIFITTFYFMWYYFIKSLSHTSILMISLHWVIYLLDKAFSSVKILLGSKKYYTSQVFKCTLKFGNNFIFLFLKYLFSRILTSVHRLENSLHWILYGTSYVSCIKTTKKFSKLFATIFSSLLNINDLQWEYFA